MKPAKWAAGPPRRSGPLLRIAVVSGGLSLLLAGSPAMAVAQAPDSATAQVKTVLRAFYQSFDAGNWDALASYVLSPKLMERRGAPADSQLVLKDRTRSRTLEHAVAPPSACPSARSPMIDDAAVRVDGDWAEVSVPRCSGAVGGVDEFRLMYFEQRWRFIYTDMF